MPTHRERPTRLRRQLYNRRLDMKEIRDYELAYGGEVERCKKWM